MSTAIAQQLALVFMGRSLDTQWASSTANLLNGGQPSVALQTAFYNSAVAEGVFSTSDSPSGLVNDIFQNIFGFGASTFEQTAWGNLITNGTLTKETAAWTIFKSYLGATNVPDAYKLPAQSKLVAMNAYSTELAADAEANLALAGGGKAAAAARAYVSGVTSQATAATAISGVAASVDALPTASAPTYTLTSSAASVNEGGAINFTLAATNVAAGTQQAYTITGVNSADVVGGSLSGVATIGADGKATISVTLVADAVTEGAETLTVSVAGKTASATVNDTSIAPVPTYALAADAASVNEGGTAIFRLTTTNVAAGSKFDYTLAGVSAADVVGGLLAGTATVGTDGKAIVEVQLAADALTEGAETLTMAVAGQSAAVTVADTSTTPIPTYALAADAASVNEGGTAIFRLTTTNVAAGSKFDYTLAGVSAADVVGGLLAGTATVGTDGKAIVEVQLAADALTEGAETLTMAVAGQSAAVTVADTSTTPVPTYALAADAASVNEGSTVVYTLTTTNVAAGTTFAYVLSGVTASDVLGGSLTGTATVDANGKAMVSVALLADTLSEGAETLTIALAGLTASTVVNDTSTSTFTLTTNQDAGTAFTGGAGNDTFNALTTTLGTGDNLVGGAGTDTLNVTGTLAATATIAAFTLDSIENVNVSLADGDAATAHVLTLNMANAGAAAVNLSGLAATTRADGLTLSNLAAGSSLAMTNSTDLNLTANFVAAATSGSADSVSVALNAVSSTAATDGILTIGAGFETLNIATSGAASSLDDVVFGGTRINVTGNQNLTVRQGLDASVTTIDANAFTGRLSVVTANNAAPDGTVAGVDVADLTITGGTAADTINISANAANNEVNVNAADGDDLVTIGQILENSTSTRASDVLNGGSGNDTLAGDIDLFDAGTALFTGTTTLTGVSGFETLSVNGFAAEANTLNVSNVSADITTVAIASAVGGATTINFGTAGAYTVNVGASAAIAAQPLTVDAGGSGTADSVTIANTNAATGTNQMGDNATAIVATDFETVTINTGSYSTATAQLVNTVNVGTNTLVLTGSNGLTTTANTGIITAGVINASGLTGALVMGAAAASGLTSITGGSAADTLIGDAASTINGGGGGDAITGGANNDVLNGDAGDDTITTGAGSDNVNGGEGNDTLVFVGDLSAQDTVAGGAGTDTISLTNASLTALKALTISEANTFNANFTSVETLRLTDALNQTTFDLGYLNSLTGVRLDAGITGAEALNGFDSGDSLDLRATLSAVLTVGVNNASTGTADAFTVTLGESAGTDYTDLSIANIETLTINNTEATASSTVRANTIGLALSQATGGAAQSVIITGTEALTIDTAIAAATINATGMTVGAATDNGLTMGVAFTATSAIAGQTITGSDKVDVLRSSTGVDNIGAGAGNDSIHGSVGADTIDGGAGTGDTYITATTMVAANIEGAGTGTSTGVVINLGSTALTNTNVLANSAQNLSSSMTSVAAGQVAYLFNDVAPTNSSVVKTLSNIENVTLAGNGINYVVGSDAANVIVGGSGVDTINAGSGADTITGNGGNDTIVLTEGTSAADVVIFSDTAANNGSDTITGFLSGTDKINIDAFGTAVAFTATGALVAYTAAANTVLLFTGGAAGDADSSAAAITFMNANLNYTDTAATFHVVIVDDNSTAIYQVLGNAGGNEFTADTLTLMGTISSVLASGDFLFS